MGVPTGSQPPTKSRCSFGLKTVVMDTPIQSLPHYIPGLRPLERADIMFGLSKVWTILKMP